MMRRMLVAALVLGSLGCDTEAEKAEQAERQRQEQEFVIAVGRSPSPDKINAAGRRDLHIVARLNLHMLAISLLEQGANANVKDNKKLLSYSGTFSDGNFNHGDTNHIFGRLGEDFKIFGQASKAAQPSQGSFDNPAFGNHLESVRRFRGDIDAEP